MDSSKLANWLQIGGNIGIVIGLILVAVQIKQSSELAHAQLVSEGHAIAMSIQLALAGEEPGIAWSKAIHRPEELTDDDLMKLEAMLRASWYATTRAEYMYELGMSSATAAFRAEAFVWDFLDNPIALAWWAEAEPARGVGYIAPKTRDAVKDLLEQLNRGEMHQRRLDYFNRLRGRMPDDAQTNGS